jgi:hypothetical protein
VNWVQGIVASGAMVVVISWCVHMRGPLFASAFNPLVLVIVALASCTMLNENLYLGRYAFFLLLSIHFEIIYIVVTKKYYTCIQLCSVTLVNEYDTSYIFKLLNDIIIR